MSSLYLLLDSPLSQRATKLKDGDSMKAKRFAAPHARPVAKIQRRPCKAWPIGSQSGLMQLQLTF